MKELQAYKQVHRYLNTVIEMFMRLENNNLFWLLSFLQITKVNPSAPPPSVSSAQFLYRNILILLSYTLSTAHSRPTCDLVAPVVLILQKSKKKNYYKDLFTHKDISTYINRVVLRNWVFATNSDFLIPISLDSNVVNLWYFKLWLLLDHII